MALRRGFKSEANAYAREFRRELALSPDAPLCPFALARLLDVETFPLSHFSDEAGPAVAYLTSEVGQRDFSAVTVCLGNKRLVIFNDGHSDPRVVADVAHELSHIILHHPSKPTFDSTGSRHYDAGREEEANWLGPALLVSEEAAILVARQGLTLALAAKDYRVSVELMRMRMNITGAYRRVRRAA